MYDQSRVSSQTSSSRRVPESASPVSLFGPNKGANTDYWIRLQDWLYWSAPSVTAGAENILLKTFIFFPWRKVCEECNYITVPLFLQTNERWRSAVQLLPGDRQTERRRRKIPLSPRRPVMRPNILPVALIPLQTLTCTSTSAVLKTACWEQKDHQCKIFMHLKSRKSHSCSPEDQTFRL